MPRTEESLGPILSAYGFASAELEPVTMGNINTTFRVTHDGQRVILQRLNPIFDAEVHYDIEVVTRHIASRGMTTPHLVPTTSGELWACDPFGGVWRVFTHMDGDIHSSGATPQLCRSAGALLARFHCAVADLEYTFRSRRPAVHDMARHLAHLRQTLNAQRDHQAYAEVARVGRAILITAGDLPSLDALPRRIVHGDPKLNNVVFSPQGTALCFIDLDTLSRMSIPVELGDAFRSWCNPTGEDDAESTFDLACFEAGVAGYASEGAKLLDAAEVAAIPVGVETITLELAARFCADALDESYFGWNEEKFPSASAHNLHRAKSQLSLARSFAKQRRRAQEIVERALR